MPTLTAADRCDRCGAAALVAVSGPSGEFLFCAHHYRENDAALSAAGGQVTADDRDLLTTLGG